MIKKIRTARLKPEMYIHDINCGWLDHPFLGRSFKVENDEMVDKIVKYGIREVYIDTDLGPDDADALTKEEVERDIHEKLHEIVEKKPEEIRHVSFNEEILNAKKIKKETIEAVQKIMNDIKLGGQIEKEAVGGLVGNIINSVFRNQDALIALGRLRKTDEYVYNHSMSVCVLMSSFAKHLGVDSGLIRQIGIGAMLHDIGTTKIPVKILSKKTALSEAEYEKIKKHVSFGRMLLERTEGITEVSIITASQHHERLDGSGYPNGLKGGEISRYGQAIAIVDVYDALTTKRCYKRKIPPTEALKMMFEWGGLQFNKELIEKFIRCVGIYPVGSLVRLESGLLGVVVNHSEESLLKPVVRIVYNTARESNIAIPYDVDLSKPLGKGGADRIISYESPEKWDILTEVYL
ncbi:MAG TPA: HD-GYP domain-containing protein [Nitrospirae bacterium]|nr:cyclic di-GMP phosphodiesterase response regulator RpfG [bacterium BMS3Abin06]HDH12406.1 HD-GYP domain-containing protein [Nitrospirota bacterium]HDY99848.1 HD-GYP domain-containing protein [Nitrospirota bacterium]